MRLAGVPLCSVILALLTGAQPARASEPIRPTEFRDTVRLSVEGAERSYWSMDTEQPLVLAARGPGRVKLITRLALGTAPQGRYELVVHEGENEVARQAVRTVAAAGVTGGGEQWGCHRDVLFQVPAGDHRYRISLSGPGSTVAVRPRLLSPRRSRSRVSLTPTKYERVLVLVREEKEITYYRVSTETPVEVTVIGPTELQVNTRLDFDQDMKGGSHSYAVAVFEGEETLARTCFEIDRSQVTSWRDQPEIVPGVVKSMVVPLPEGKHQLVIRLMDTVAHSAGVKLYIPEQDVSLAATR